jgi:hypothetical protein
VTTAPPRPRSARGDRSTDTRVALVSIHPELATEIFPGRKRVEFRRRAFGHGVIECEQRAPGQRSPGRALKEHKMNGNAERSQRMTLNWSSGRRSTRVIVSERRCCRGPRCGRAPATAPLRGRAASPRAARRWNGSGFCEGAAEVGAVVVAAARSARLALEAEHTDEAAVARALRARRSRRAVELSRDATKRRSLGRIGWLHRDGARDPRAAGASRRARPRRTRGR